ncbi:MAG: FISUMP domain-containing protein [Bacteroidales bacterium]
MKKLLTLLCVTTLLTGCDSDDSIMLENLSLSSNQTQMYYDSEMPALSLKIVPEGAPNQLEWTSSNPEVLAVDAKGKLTLKKFNYTTVTITATDQATKKTASCQIVLAIKKANISDYGIIAMKDKLGFDVLDRNIGASATYKKNGTDAEKQAAIGEYYQWGNSIPTGTFSEVNTYYDKEANGGDLDWSKPENTPCPEGWRIPNMAEMKKLSDAAWVDWDGFIQTDEEFEAAKAIYNALLIARGGYYKIDGANKSDRDAAKPTLHLPGSGAFWSCELNKTAGSETSERGFKQAYAMEDNSFVIMNKKTEVNRAMPIRCIK